MSFLSGLLNPASEPAQPSHLQATHNYQSPEPYDATRPSNDREDSRMASYPLPPLARTTLSPYDAASTLAPIQQARDAQSSSSQYSSVPYASSNFQSPSLPSITSFSNAASQARNSSNATSLAQYRSSQSPDELRRQNLSTFEPRPHHYDHSIDNIDSDSVYLRSNNAVLNEVRNFREVLPPLSALAGQPSASTAHSARHSAFGLGLAAGVPGVAKFDVHLQAQTQNYSRTSASPPPPLLSQYHNPFLQHSQKRGKMEGAEDGTTAIEQPAPTQIREPSLASTEAQMTPLAPEPAVRQPLDNDITSPLRTIKDEASATPLGGTPTKKEPHTPLSADHEGGNVDVDTMKAIEAAKNDFGLRVGRQKAHPSIEEPTPPPSQATMTVQDEKDPKSKKRSAPKVKKGQATVKKPPTKKRKTEDGASITARRSLSPGRANKTSAQRIASGAGKKSKSNTPALGSSPAPASVASGVEEDYASDAESTNSNDVFCICRKGDNHTWMIACDGGCEDWFHGKCVHILEEDGELIDKYICPNCSEASGKVTTWLPGCRNRGCRKPARIRKGNMSKYCSDECGREFMEGEVKRSEAARRAASGHDKSSTSHAKPRRKGITMAEINGESTQKEDNSDDDLGPRGSALKPSELKALVAGAAGDVSAFRALGGTGVLSPPASVSPTAERFPTTAESKDETQFTTTEGDRLTSIAAEKDDLRRRRALLKDREKFSQLVRDCVTRYATREKVKPKEICGYDGRLAWGEVEFKLWRDSAQGQKALAEGVLELPPSLNEINGDKMDIDGAAETAPKPATMCTRKRCERHRQWQKQTLADVRFEESQLADRMRGLEKEEREVRESAALRRRMREGGLSGEGVVEVVG